MCWATADIVLECCDQHANKYKLKPQAEPTPTSILSSIPAGMLKSREVD